MISFQEIFLQTFAQAVCSAGDSPPAPTSQMGLTSPNPSMRRHHFTWETCPELQNPPWCSLPLFRSSGPPGGESVCPGGEQGPPVCVLITQSCPILCNPKECSLPPMFLITLHCDCCSLPPLSPASLVRMQACEIMAFAATWMDLEIIILSKVSQGLSWLSQWICSSRCHVKQK